MDTPAAEVDVDAELVERLVRSQHPDLAGPLTLVAHGWDNVLFRLGSDLSVRLPRRQIAADLVAKEQRWLPELADRVSVGIPGPVRIGVPGEGYPWHWTIGPWFEGQAAADMPPSERAPIAADLASFLAELHVPAPASVPANPVRGVPLSVRADAVEKRLDSGAVPRAEELRRLWKELSATAPWAGPALWVHGDLHAANIVIDTGDGNGSARLAAVIDFGDLTSGDPATDLAVAWMVFEADARADFRAHVDRLSGVDDHTWKRAHAWALCLGTALAAHSDDNPRMAAMGTHALKQVLAGD
ncbi:aminoglycoside phosphotransferase family protein [Phytoactinopolyspora mesophila]|uniref:Phosphotransferase n=1 Tax=Phytoactinopolyspora mesophila TaxID=2650750 RepID=A0A7K3MBH6_9ACTN|nr:aminoglycoside phosphotransferase family protein [Phytoactinopolyspora mesophila]NDL60616.1 phosphotransferase [Phytoactinopolyspora mesophila]